MNTQPRGVVPSRRKEWHGPRAIRIPGANTDAQSWLHESGISALSAIDVVQRNPPGSGLVVPHFHVSARHNPLVGAPRACTDQQMEIVRAAFDMGGAEEDNHGPGVVRHLWLEVGRDRQPEVMGCHVVKSLAEFHELRRALDKLCSPGAQPNYADWVRARKREPGLSVLEFLRRERP